MRLLFLLFIPLPLFEQRGKMSSSQINIDSDTCFYKLLVPPDLDLPSTPAFDTTIVREGNCKTQILRLQSWGTETEYKLSGTVNGISYSRSAHFFAGRTNPRFIDITALPEGTYSVSLLACGNGGTFMVRIRG